MGNSLEIATFCVLRMGETAVLQYVPQWHAS